MSFEQTPRIIALHPDNIPAILSPLLAQYGEELPDGFRTIRTIGAHWDDGDHTRMRAADFPTTITGQPLSDGRVAFTALWQSDLAAALPTIPGVQELTPAELTALTPPPEPLPT